MLSLPGAPLFSASLVLVSIAVAAPSTWTVTSENDSPWSLMWGNPYRDEYYTNGIRLSGSWWVADHTDRGLGRAADVVARGLGLGKADVVELGASQTMYTPIEIWETTIPDTVHPYAGHLHFTAGLGAVGKGFRSSVELLGGWTGPPAFGEPAQKKVHELFNGYEPLGWDHQVQFEPTFGVSVWLAPENFGTISDGGVTFRFVPSVLAVASTPDLAAEAGFLVGVGTRDDVPSTRPDEARFGHSGIDRPRRGPSKVGVALYAALDFRLSAHDMFVSGGTFSSIPAPEAEAAWTEGALCATLRLGGTRITMANNFQGFTYVGQERDHRYGTISVSQDFGVKEGVRSEDR